LTYKNGSGKHYLIYFCAPQGHYEWIVMSISFKNAPQIFRRRMDNIFKDLNYCYLVHIDDILIFSKTIEQHKDEVLAIIQRFIDHGIILDKNKCINVEHDIKFQSLEIKAGQIILENRFYKKKGKFF